MNALDLRCVSVRFGHTVALESVSLQLPEHELLALIGPNGGGKTVLLKVLLGLIVPGGGEVRVLGQAPREARCQVAYLPQHPAFERDFPISVEDVVLMGRLRACRGLRRFNDVDRERAREALEQVGAAPLARRPLDGLSGGQIQRVLIARALASEARLLLLDEPTAGLDPTMAFALYEHLAALRKRMTVVVVSHDVGVVMPHVTAVACLNRRLHYHPSRGITAEMIEATYGCPVDSIVHGHTHRHLAAHEHEHAQERKDDGEHEDACIAAGEHRDPPAKAGEGRDARAAVSGERQKPHLDEREPRWVKP